MGCAWFTCDYRDYPLLGWLNKILSKDGDGNPAVSFFVESDADPFVTTCDNKLGYEAILKAAIRRSDDNDPESCHGLAVFDDGETYEPLTCEQIKAVGLDNIARRLLMESDGCKVIRITEEDTNDEGLTCDQKYSGMQILQSLLRIDNNTGFLALATKQNAEAGTCDFNCGDSSFLSAVRRAVTHSADNPGLLVLSNYIDVEDATPAEIQRFVEDFNFDGDGSEWTQQITGTGGSFTFGSGKVVIVPSTDDVTRLRKTDIPQLTIGQNYTINYSIQTGQVTNIDAQLLLYSSWAGGDSLTVNAPVLENHLYEGGFETIYSGSDEQDLILGVFDPSGSGGGVIEILKCDVWLTT